MTCLIQSYTALQNIQALTSGDYIYGVKSLPHVKKQSQQIPSYPTTVCLVLGIRCAEGSTRMRPATSNSKTCSRATIPICTELKVLKPRLFNFSLPSEKRWSLTIPKCMAAKIQYDVNGHKDLTTPKPLPNSTAERTTWWRFPCHGCLTITISWCGNLSTSLKMEICHLVKSLSTLQPYQSLRHHKPKNTIFHTPAF